MLVSAAVLVQGLKGGKPPEQEVGRNPVFYIIPQRAPFSKAHEDRRNGGPGATEKQTLRRDGQDFCGRRVCLIESRI